jgi:hypothetical protein
VAALIATIVVAASVMTTSGASAQIVSSVAGQQVDGTTGVAVGLAQFALDRDTAGSTPASPQQGDRTAERGMPVWELISLGIGLLVGGVALLLLIGRRRDHIRGRRLTG